MNKIKDNSKTNKTQKKKQISFIKLFLYLAPIIGIVWGVFYIRSISDFSIEKINKIMLSEMEFQKVVLDIINENSVCADIVNEQELVNLIHAKFEDKLDKKINTVVVEHLVVHGESINSISKRYNITPEELIDWNPPLSNHEDFLPINSVLKIYVPKKMINDIWNKNGY